jgi:hypothetical protein
MFSQVCQRKAVVSLASLPILGQVSKQPTAHPGIGSTGEQQHERPFDFRVPLHLNVQPDADQQHARRWNRVLDLTFALGPFDSDPHGVGVCASKAGGHP